MDYVASPSLAETSVVHSACDFEAIVKLYRPKIFRFLLASLRDSETAENLTQDCFFKAYQGLPRFRHDCKIGTWLMQIAVNLIRDDAKNRRLQFWRRLRRTAKPLEEELRGYVPDQHRSPEAQIVLQEQVDAIWKVAARLPGNQQTVFLLRFVEDMDLPEIAVVMGLKAATVKTHLFRALASVREQLGVQA
jgi:RNA polymerase sigma-70 factor (ECF subfamily)